MKCIEKRFRQNIRLTDSDVEIYKTVKICTTFTVMRFKPRLLTQLCGPNRGSLRFNNRGLNRIRLSSGFILFHIYFVTIWE